MVELYWLGAVVCQKEDGLGPSDPCPAFANSPAPAHAIPAPWQGDPCTAFPVTLNVSDYEMGWGGELMLNLTSVSGVPCRGQVQPP